MTISFSKVHSMSPSDVRWFGADFQDDLSSTETLSSATVTQVGTTHLTIASVSVNAASTDIDDREVAIGKGVTWKTSGQTLGTLYVQRVNVTTSSGETIVRDAQFECK